MSSDSNSTGSTLGQFGLYRSIDARTQEFLRLSKRRQIRQGCACAVISTAITVTVVFIILLIYEYAIAVQWSEVQRDVHSNGNNEPYAERLDRSHFGFDQDYFEQMPVLLNSLQENNYMDPSLDIIPTIRSSHNRNIKTTTAKPYYKYNSVRRTSPRPFFFEYRSPAPLPFSQTYGSKSWVERYRNAERLQNIRKVIKYLEKTINAKIGDMHTKPTGNSVAFTGLYVEPMMHKSEGVDKKAEIDLIVESSDKADAFTKINNEADPLFNYKPDNPAEVNLLADAFLRFSSIPKPNVYKEISTSIPLHSTKNKKCFGRHCNENVRNIADIIKSQSTTNTYIDRPLKNTKSFSVMLNLYPFKTTTSSFRNTETARKPQSNSDKIYFTTIRPNIQFRRKSVIPLRRHIFKKRPRQVVNGNYFSKTKDNKEIKDINPTKMTVNVNIFSTDHNTGSSISENLKNNVGILTTLESISTTPRKHYYTTEAIVNPEEVEDFHAGSSGILPVITEYTSVEPTITEVTTVPLILEPNKLNDNNWVRNIPKVVKFSVEDAKVPDDYLELKKLSSLSTDVNNLADLTGDFQENNKELSTLTVKLKNSAITSEITNVSTEEEVTTQTYVPQINGHYRNSKVNRTVQNDLAFENSRKRILETSVKHFRKSYVEIRRNNTQKITSNDD